MGASLELHWVVRCSAGERLLKLQLQILEVIEIVQQTMMMMMTWVARVKTKIRQQLFERVNHCTGRGALLALR